MDPRIETINFFKKLIKDRIRKKQPTRAKHLFGALSTHEAMRKWFTAEQRYPTPDLHVKFFHDNAAHFNYDDDTGNITVNSTPVSFVHKKKNFEFKFKQLAAQDPIEIEIFCYTFDLLNTMASSAVAANGIELGALLSAIESEYPNLLTHYNPPVGVNQEAMEAFNKRVLSALSSFKGIINVDGENQVVMLDKDVLEDIATIKEIISKFVDEVIRNLITETLSNSYFPLEQSMKELIKLLKRNYPSLIEKKFGITKSDALSNEMVVKFAAAFPGDFVIKPLPKIKQDYIELVGNRNTLSKKVQLALSAKNQYGPYIRRLKGSVKYVKKQRAEIITEFTDPKVDPELKLSIKVDGKETKIDSHHFEDLEKIIHKDDRLEIDAAFDFELNTWLATKILVVEHTSECYQVDLNNIEEVPKRSLRKPLSNQLASLGISDKRVIHVNQSKLNQKVNKMRSLEKIDEITTITREGFNIESLA